MSGTKLHKLLMLALFVLACVALFMLFLEPILGVQWILLWSLLGVIFCRKNPQICRAEKKRWKDACNSMKDRLFATPFDAQTIDMPVYELIMVKPQTGETYPIDRKTYLIGRSRNCDLTLLHSDTLGREHCRIVYREHSREYYIEDLRSKNGTYLGTRRLEPNTQVKLLAHAEIFIGDYCLRFERKTGSRNNE